MSDPFTVALEAILGGLPPTAVVGGAAMMLRAWLKGFDESQKAQSKALGEIQTKVAASEAVGQGMARAVAKVDELQAALALERAKADAAHRRLDEQAAAAKELRVELDREREKAAAEAQRVAETVGRLREVLTAVRQRQAALAASMAEFDRQRRVS